MIDKAILTSCSNKFFPGVINLIGSIKTNYPNHPPIYVYDQGLLPIFRKELESIENISVIKIPAFCPHWKACYTWKTYIFNNPPAELNLYLDSGFEVLQPLDETFSEIEKNGYLAVSQNAALSNTAPEEYKKIFNIEEKYYAETYITAGIFGFKKESVVTNIIHTLYDMAVAGMCLGFSPTEQWRNKGKNKSIFIRNCALFRFDTSILSLLMRKELGDFIINPQENYELGTFLNNPTQLIYNARLKRIIPTHIHIKTFTKHPTFIFYINHIYIKLFLYTKKISNSIKNTLR